MKTQVFTVIVCLLVSAQFTHAGTKDDTDQSKLKDATVLTAEQKAKLKEAAAAKEDAKPVKDQKARDTAVTTTNTAQKTAETGATTKDKTKSVKDQKTKDTTVNTDKTKNNTATTTTNPASNTTVKTNEIDPNIQAMINQQLQDKKARKNYKTTYSQDGKTVNITYQNDQDNKYCPSKKTKKYNPQTLDDLQTTGNYNNSTDYTKESAEQLKQKKLYANDKKLIAGIKGSFGDEWKTDALDTLKATRGFMEKLKDAGFQYKDITAISANADEKAFWKSRSSNSGEISISPDSDPGLIANMAGLGFYEKLRDKGYKAQSAQDMAEVIRYFVEARMGNSKWEASESAAPILKSCDYSEDKFIAMLKNGEMKKLLNK